MSWIILIIGLIGTVEVFRFLNIINELLILKQHLIKSLSAVLNKKFSDDEKRKILLKFSLELFKNSIKILLLFLLGLSPLLVIILVSNLFGMEIFKLIGSFYGMIASLIFCITYLYLRGKIGTK